MTEAILEPDLPIIDPHHHLWDRRAILAQAPAPRHGFEHVIRRAPHYLLDELLADTGSGHNVRATVFVECRSMYRADGSVELKPVGETEFVNGIAAQCASGLYGEIRACAGIVGHVDLTLGQAAGSVLDAHLAASPRFRGVRHSASWDADPDVLGPLHLRSAGLYRDATFRQGFAQLAPRGLSFDAWLLEPQLPDLIDLARAFPDTSIVLDHVGTPLGVGAYRGRLPERFETWRSSIRDLAQCPNVVVKLGGLAMAFCNLPSFMSEPPAASTQLAQEWRPYIETCIEAFGPDRAMFESNFPVDILSCDYATLWNALKLIAKDASADEKRALFAGTAKRVYRLDDIAL
ncbi:MAG: amidohydrolase [Caulobacteraceae bacterium]|nr:amidohydrolase [Caulobacteraceae bacterium]